MSFLILPLLDKAQDSKGMGMAAGATLRSGSPILSFSPAIKKVIKPGSCSPLLELVENNVPPVHTAN